jgi:hypothetical protein
MGKLPRSKLQVRKVMCLMALILFVPPEVRADLHFPQPQADVGHVFSGTPLTHCFAFANRGPGPVEITDLRASCGCMTPRLSRRIYQSGEQGELLLQVNTLSQAPGLHTWRLQVTYRSGDTLSEAVVELAAALSTEVEVEPAAVTMFTGGSVEQEIVVTDLRPRPLMITGVRATSSGMAPQLGEPYRDAAGHCAWKIHVAVAPDFSEGRHEEVLGIYTDDTRYHELQVPVTIVKRCRERLSATPSEVALTAPPGQPVPSRIVLVRDHENQQVVVDRVEADDPAVACRWSAGPNTMATVKIQVDRQRVRTGSFHTLVHVYVSKPAKQMLTIPVSCELP